MSKFILLHLEGTHQSWAGDSAGQKERTSEMFPTRSGVLGTSAAALGLLRTDPRVDALHRSCRVSSRVLRKGQVRMEYQNIRDWDIKETEASKKAPSLRDFYKKLPDPRQVWRSYHTDAAFQVVLEVGEGCPFTAGEILAALRKPMFPIYLGRKYCCPSYPLVGATDTVIEAASPVDVFGPVSAHVRAVRGEKYGEDGWEGDRYTEAKHRIAFLDLQPGMSAPTLGRTVPIEIGDVLLSNAARSFTTRVGLAWHMEAP